MKDSKKLERMIEWLTTEHLYGYGGYEYGHVEHAGKVFVAALDGGKEYGQTCIDSYDVSELIAWYDRAAAEMKRKPWDVDSWSEAFFETENAG